MCGIFACLHGGDGSKECLKPSLLERLRRRGPDRTGKARVCLGTLWLDLVGTLLHMRGDATPQPLTNSKGDHLLWNGNVFGGEIKIAPGENDTVRVFEQLEQQRDATGILSTLSKIHGPWSFVYWQKSTNSLWFGRDVFGRRSLLWHLPVAGESLLVSSIGHYDPPDMPLGFWQEVPAMGVFQLKIVESDFKSTKLVCHPWMEGDICFQDEASITEELKSVRTSLRINITKITSLQVSFPPLNRQLPQVSNPNTGLEVTSDKEQLPAVATGFPTALTLKPESEQQSEAHGACVPAESHYSTRVHQAALARSSASATSIEAHQLLSVLQTAILARVVRAPHVRKVELPAEATDQVVVKLKQEGSSSSCTSGSHSWVTEGEAKVAILFSGGVDSVVLAALTDRCLDVTEEIDLINVAFGERASHDAPSACFNVPDRKSAIESLKELNPSRKWNLVLVNVTREEVNTARKEHISHLIYPLCTVLDDSIGCALWFAARGEGVLYQPGAETFAGYRSRAKTLFIGIGADEQLAGYSRHRTKFKSVGWKGLIEEVEKDVKRLAKRNLGRDDRCVADHQRDGQFPFLDEEVVAFLQQLPMSHKADLSLPRGTGEKRLLREVASILGCCTAATIPKRAIQFGSRMAKLAGSSNSREHGSDICDRLLPPTV